MMTQVTFDIPSKKLAPQIPVVVPTKRTTSVVTLLADADILDNFRNSEHAKLGPAHCIPCPEPPAALHSVPPECSSITKSEQSHQINCHPQGNGLGDPAKYKTRICRNWLQGECQFGAACSFAHGEDELRSFEQEEQLEYQPKRQLPQRYKTRMCHNWLHGECEFGAACSFAHGEEELRACEEEATSEKTPGYQSTSHQIPVRYKTRMCRNWLQGECQVGAVCSFAHGEDELRPLEEEENLESQPKQHQPQRYKTRMCHNWLHGECEFGAACSFAHGEDELRSFEEDTSSEKAPVYQSTNHQIPIRYKTRMCRNWLTAECKFGAVCSFAHGEDELRSSEEDAPLWGHQSTEKDFLLRYKTQTCRNWLQGECAFGAACTFAHGEDELRPSKEAASEKRPGHQSAERPVRRKTTLCRNWIKGHCNFADACHFAHGNAELEGPEEERQGDGVEGVQSSAQLDAQARATAPKYKTTMCCNWLQGHCEYGPVCIFAHGDAELRAGTGAQSTPFPSKPTIVQGRGADQMPAVIRVEQCRFTQEDAPMKPLIHEVVDTPSLYPESGGRDTAAHADPGCQTSKIRVDDASFRSLLQNLGQILEASHRTEVRP
jgi:hypothetical protein